MISAIQAIQRHFPHVQSPTNVRMLAIGLEADRESLARCTVPVAVQWSSIILRGEDLEADLDVLDERLQRGGDARPLHAVQICYGLAGTDDKLELLSEVIDRVRRLQLRATVTFKTSSLHETVYVLFPFVDRKKSYCTPRRQLSRQRQRCGESIVVDSVGRSGTAGQQRRQQRWQHRAKI